MVVQRLKGSLYILAGVVTWYFVRSMSEWIVARRFFPIPNVIFDMGDLFYHLLGLGSALTIVIFLWKHNKSKVFLDEVSVETSKVTWPTLKDTRNATVVVTIAILIAGFALGGMDWTIGAILKWGFFERFMSG